MDKHEKVVGLGLDLYALGINIEIKRAALGKLVKDGYDLSYSEVMATNELLNAYCNQFIVLEEKYVRLKAELEK